MRSIVLLILFLITESTTRGGELHLLQIDELSTEYWRYEQPYRNSYLLNGDGTPLKLRDGGSLNLNLTPVKYTYMDNKWHMANSEDSHPRYVGWEWEAGLRLGKIDLFHHHHSQHGLEYENPRGDSFPLENYWGVRVRLLGDK